ncbi:MAG: hypothetical protein Q7V31_15015 [Parvibaculum sp.]|uniref:hypothetical protein n=1 Tax=Parvibaculum sp. TaxID=2024848 RepID=UPI00272682BF|nr:hypothetical protein [Parvibaculum sp.]MDO8840225.1 hypothetical protein [Parvibaculum sp.]
MTHWSRIATLSAALLFGLSATPLAADPFLHDDPNLRFHQGLDDSMRPGLSAMPRYVSPECCQPGRGSTDSMEYKRLEAARLQAERRAAYGNDNERERPMACRMVMMDAPDAFGRIGQWRADECLDASGAPYIRPGSQFNMGY